MRHRRGMTLIELLVVVAVIAGLLAILLPALANARRCARVTACLVNLKGIGVATASYMHDGKDFVLPWHLGFDYNGESANFVTPTIYGGSQLAVDDSNYVGTDQYKYKTEWRPFTQYVAPGAAGTKLIDTYVCPGFSAADTRVSTA